MTDQELQPGEESPENPIGVPDSATGEQVKPEGDGGGEKDPDGYVKAINRKHYQFKEQERRADALEVEVTRLRAESPQDSRPEIPELPEAYDENFSELIAKRDKAVTARAEYDARQTALADKRQTEQEAASQKQQAAIVESAQTYSERATKLGVSEQEMAAAGKVVDAFGIDDALVEFILADEQGPLITSFLAKNPNELEVLQGLTTVQAAVRIATKIRPQLTAAPGVSGAPPPPDSLGGGGAPPAERGPEGATYE